MRTPLTQSLYFVIRLLSHLIQRLVRLSRYGLAKRWDAEPESPANEVTTVMAVVIFTTFVLGSTVASLIRLLGLDGPPDTHAHSSAEAVTAAAAHPSSVAAVDSSVAVGAHDDSASGTLVDASATAAMEAEGGLDERDILNGRARKRSVPTTPRLAPRKSDFGLMDWFRRMDATVVTPVVGGKRAKQPTNTPFCGLCDRGHRPGPGSTGTQSSTLGAGLLASGAITGSE